MIQDSKRTAERKEKEMLALLLDNEDRFRMGWWLKPATRIMFIDMAPTRTHAAMELADVPNANSVKTLENPQNSSIETEKTVNVLPRINANPLRQFAGAPPVSRARSANFKAKPPTRFLCRWRDVLACFADQKRLAMDAAGVVVLRSWRLGESHPDHPPAAAGFTRSL